MTLCVAWIRKVEKEDQLVLATDSMITGGLDYPHGTKLLAFDRGDCGLCWEGSTWFTYSFTENARVDINFSDRLGTASSPLFAVKDRITKVFNQLWQANLADKGSNFKNEKLSFLFGGFCPEFREIQLWHIRQDEQLQSFTAQRRTPSANKPCFVGSGSGHARTMLGKEPALSPYQVLLKVIEEDSVRGVGGVPQLVSISRTGLEIIGVVKEDGRYLFGRKLASTGHKTKVRYVPYNGDGL